MYGKGHNPKNGNFTLDPADAMKYCWMRFHWVHPIDRWLIGVIAIPVILLAMFTNAISAYVFSRKQLRAQPINVYLLALSIADFVQLPCNFALVGLSRLAEIFSYWRLTWISMFIMVGMCVHRFIGCWFPLHARHILSSTSTVYRYLGVVTFLVFIFCSTTHFLMREMRYCYYKNIKYVLPIVEISPLGERVNYYFWFKWITFVLGFYVPLGILCVANAFVIVAIRRSRRFRQTTLSAAPSSATTTTTASTSTGTALGREQSSPAATTESNNNNNNAINRDKNEVRISTMLAVNVLAFLACSMPYNAYMLSVLLELPRSLNWLLFVSYFATYVNSLLNAYIYWRFIPRYVDVVQGLIRSLWRFVCRSSRDCNNVRVGHLELTPSKSNTTKMTTAESSNS